MKILYKIILVVSGGLIGLIIAEECLSLFLPQHIFNRLDISTPWADYTLSKNQKIMYLPKPNHKSLNSYGHRGHEFPFKKENRNRIVFMGDSVVEGLGVNVGERFSDILGGMLGNKYDIINIGVRGYSFEQEFEYLKMLGMKFSPDYVIFGVTYNDLVLHSGEICIFNFKMQDNSKSGFYREYYKTRKGAESVLLRSNMFKLLKYMQAYKPAAIFQDSDFRLDSGQVKDMLTQLKDMSKTREFKLIFALLPSNTQDGAADIRLIKDSLDSNGIQCLDLRILPAEFSGNKLFLPNDPCHLNVEGNKYVAEQLYDARKTLGF